MYPSGLQPFGGGGKADTLEKYQDKLIIDQNVLVKKVNIVFESFKLINEWSKNLNEGHLKEKVVKFNQTVMKSLTKNNNNTMNHDELLRIQNMVADFNFQNKNIKDFSKESIFSNNNFLLIKF